MSYEEEYNAALERAKRLRESKYQTMNAKRVVDEIFPQLAESEDERIRKGLVKLLTDASKTFLIETTGIEKASYLAYLEKQKEQKVDIDKLRRDIYQSGYNDGYQHGKEDAQKEQKPPIAGNDFGWIDELKHVLKHPEELDQKVDDVLKQRKGIRALEWSDEDERLCNLIAKCIALGRKQGLVNDDDNIACLDLLMRKGTSWSMGDEKMLKLIISELEQEGKDVNAPELYKIEIDWLKSLRPPQYCEDCKLKRSVENWKPSEEQMDALNYAIAEWDGGKKLEGLYDLRTDLKKLM